MSSKQTFERATMSGVNYGNDGSVVGFEFVTDTGEVFLQKRYSCLGVTKHCLNNSTKPILTQANLPVG
jgi:hypothetical protein